MLCNICQGFDIHALFSLAASRTVKEKPKLAVHGVFPEFQGFPEFYKHHHGLVALRSSAEAGCRLCTFIWQNWAQSVPPDVFEREWIAAGRGGELIFLGLSKWAPESQGIPYLSVVQNTQKDIQRNLGMFEVVAERGSVPRGFEHLLAREVHLSPASDSCLSIAVGWLDDCVTKHKSCQKLYREPKQLPTRVIDVGSPEGKHEPRLVVTNAAYGSWAALSYCWGGDSSFVLKSSNMQDMLSGIPLESFPATLRDAVRVTRCLNLRYLWIDAACILQDSPEDWAVEAKRMGDVYRNAKITISAISSPGVGFGMLFEREGSALSCRLDWISTKDEDSTSIYLRTGSHLWDVNMRSSPLNTRGWTLQEALLSPRTLSYGTQQMIWECQECRIDEGGRPVAPGEKYREKKFIQDLINTKAESKKQAMLRRMAAISIPKLLNQWTLKFQQPYDRWFDIVGEYTSRKLTVATDVLPALSGLAKAFHNLLGDKYCAGLWANDILRGLMWVRVGPDAASRPLQQLKPHDYIIPSWSWASIPGRRVTYVYPPTDEYCVIEEQAKVLEVSTAPRFDDPFGQTKGGCLMIQAYYCDIQDPRIGIGQDTSKSTPILQSKLHIEYTNVPWIRAEFHQQHQEHEDQKFGVLLLAQSFTERGIEIRKGWTKFPAITLLIVETTGMLENEYRRVGLHITTAQGFTADDISDMQFFQEIKRAGWKERKIRLV